MFLKIRKKRFANPLCFGEKQFIGQIFTEKRPLDTVAVGAVSRVFETVGLSLFLTWWGTRTNPFD